jgi:two-component system, NtrC family, response regulator AtoC
MAQNFISTAIADSFTAQSPLFVPGVSSSMRLLERTIADIAQTDIPVLLFGENGTGKEIVALEIHRRSRHCNEPFMKWGCAGLSADVLAARLQSEGVHGAARSRGGTLFLDEIGLLDQASQARLVDLLPESTGVPLENSLTARVISSSTRNLDEEIRCGRFSEGLFYRVNGVFLRIPPLRHCKEDIPVLLEFFLRKYSALFGRSEPDLTPETMDLLMRHDWPGNVRELENVARKMVALGNERLMAHDLLTREALENGGPVPARTSRKPEHDGQSLKEASREASRHAERELILKQLQRTHWNRKRTAKDLQISYKALRYKLKQLGLEGSDDSEEAPSGDGK